MTNQTLAFIGAGNMAQALLGGLLQEGFTAEAITAADPYQPNLDKLQQQYGITAAANNAEAVANADIVVLAVKPQVLQQACAEIRDAVQQRKPLIISIAAGITLASMQKWLGEDQAIVRCMPNTPALLQTGATGLFANANVSADQQRVAEKVLASVGITAWVANEDDIDAVTALSGSGPAYFFLVMEAMQEVGINMGLAPELVQQFVQQTALGAARMADGEDVAELRRKVTSPGGTTEAALGVFEQGQLKSLFAQALEAARERGAELAAALD